MTIPTAPDPPPGMSRAAVVCRHCSISLADLGAEEASTRTIVGDRWTLYAPGGANLGGRGVDLSCPEHGSRGRWKAATIAERAAKEWASAAQYRPEGAEVLVAVPV